MILMFYMFSFFLFVSSFFICISFIISKKSFSEKEKCSPFECGFDPNSFTRIPFSLHFFLIMLIFLIFDIEIALLLPMITLFKLVNMLIWMKISFFFIMILLIGLFHEWNQNMINWIT